jgi:hypothetical protein
MPRRPIPGRSVLQPASTSSSAAAFALISQAALLPLHHPPHDQNEPTATSAIQIIAAIRSWVSEYARYNPPCEASWRRPENVLRDPQHHHPADRRHRRSCGAGPQRHQHEQPRQQSRQDQRISAAMSIFGKRHPLGQRGAAPQVDQIQSILQCEQQVEDKQR